jgi:crotonobetainyl-CoA:carnitine CoA-transferase CaiB-like acyl-CoA transferase
MFAALGGLGHLTGYADGPPVELRHAMDHTGGMMAAFAAVAALSARQRTGLGQHVDVSVRDLAASFIGPELLDVAMNLRDPHRIGNRDPSAAPQGVYRCRGEDEWLSLSVTSEEEWQGFVEAMGSPGWAAGDEFGDAFAAGADTTSWTPTSRNGHSGTRRPRRRKYCRPMVWPLTRRWRPRP